MPRFDVITAFLLIVSCAAAQGARAAYSDSFSLPSTPSPVVSPPPQRLEPLVTPQFPVLPPPVSTVRDTLPLLPTDVTRVFNPQGMLGLPALNPANAVKRLKQGSFPDPDNAQSDDGISIRYLPGSDYKKMQPALVNLAEGALLISVSKPARLGTIVTPHGTVAVGEGSVIVRYQGGVLRVMNLTGLSENVKVSVHSAEVSATLAGADKSFAPVKNYAIELALKVGHELVSADRPLTRADLHPRDGVGRRQSALIEENLLAVSEFSLESAINGSDLILDLRQKLTGVKERRILADMAKMASVLNYINGEQGFTSRQ